MRWGHLKCRIHKYHPSDMLNWHYKTVGNKYILNNAKHGTGARMVDPLHAVEWENSSSELKFLSATHTHIHTLTLTHISFLSFSLSVLVFSGTGSLGEAAGRLRGRRPGKAQRLRGAGAQGPAGEVIGIAIVPAAWGWRGEGLGWGACEEAKRRGLLNYLCSLWPFSLTLIPLTLQKIQSLSSTSLSTQYCTKSCISANINSQLY